MGEINSCRDTEIPKRCVSSVKAMDRWHIGEHSICRGLGDQYHCNCQACQRIAIQKGDMITF
jgi:hypothetical protein